MKEIKNDMIYRLCRGYLMGFGLAATLMTLGQVGSTLQLLFGVAVGTVGYKWYKARK